MPSGGRAKREQEGEFKVCAAEEASLDLAGQAPGEARTASTRERRGVQGLSRSTTAQIDHREPVAEPVSLKRSVQVDICWASLLNVSRVGTAACMHGDHVALSRHSARSAGRACDATTAAAKHVRETVGPAPRKFAEA